VSAPDDTLLEFPCRFPIKIMGANEPDFTRHAMALVASHVDDLSDDHVASRVSRNGRFLALTVHIEARSKAQLDAIYLSLSQSKRVLMAL
jgi:putative lipoic acid-binding regulatory protein